MVFDDEDAGSTLNLMLNFSLYVGNVFHLISKLVQYTIYPASTILKNHPARSLRQAESSLFRFALDLASM